jgi:phosphohistidine phosphatase
MKRLTLLRHAKSSWKDLSLPDADRKLNKRGKRTAPEMGGRFATHYSVEDVLLVSSPARRAITTARLFAEAAGMATDSIQEDERIYQADARALLEIVRGLDDAWDHIVLVGHNPGFTDFINSATKHFIENLPTAGIAVLQYPVDHWADVGAAPAVLAELAVPKKKKR